MLESLKRITSFVVVLSILMIGIGFDTHSSPAAIYLMKAMATFIAIAMAFVDQLYSITAKPVTDVVFAFLCKIIGRVLKTPVIVLNLTAWLLMGMAAGDLINNFVNRVEPNFQLASELSQVRVPVAHLSYDKVRNADGSSALVAYYDFKVDIASLLNKDKPSDKSTLIVKTTHPITAIDMHTLPDRVKADSEKLLKGCDNISSKCEYIWTESLDDGTFNRCIRTYGVLGINGFSPLENILLPIAFIVIALLLLITPSKSDRETNVKSLVSTAMSGLVIMTICVANSVVASFYLPLL